MNGVERFAFVSGYNWDGVFGGLAVSKAEGTTVRYDNLIQGQIDDALEEETWLDLLEKELHEHGEKLADTVKFAGFEPQRVPDYDDKGWTVWSKTRVYFPEVYDGRYSIRSLPREPSNEICYPVGGGN